MLVASDPARSAALADALTAVLPAGRVLVGEAVPDDYAHDEALTVTPVRPAILVRPESSAEVAEVLRLADDHGVPVTARG